MSQTSMIVPEVGAHIEVTVANPQASGQIPPGPGLTVWRGEVLAPHRWLTDREFCMTGDSAWPVRVINMSLVRGLRFVTGQGRTINTAVQTWQVPGSRGNVYTVTKNAAGWSCTCAGWQFRRNCRHVTERAG